MLFHTLFDSGEQKGFFLTDFLLAGATYMPLINFTDEKQDAGYMELYGNLLIGDKKYLIGVDSYGTGPLVIRRIYHPDCEMSGKQGRELLAKYQSLQNKNVAGLFYRHIYRNLPLCDRFLDGMEQFRDQAYISLLQEYGSLCGHGFFVAQTADAYRSFREHFLRISLIGMKLDNGDIHNGLWNRDKYLADITTNRGGIYGNGK